MFELFYTSSNLVVFVGYNVQHEDSVLSVILVHLYIMQSLVFLFNSASSHCVQQVAAQRNSIPPVSLVKHTDSFEMFRLV